jgi:AsmA protein
VTTGVKRFAILVGLVIVAGVTALAAARLFIPVDDVRDAVINDIRAATGLDPMVRGPVSISMFPSGTVTFSDVVLGEPEDGSSAFVTKKLTARLRFGGLVAGRIEIADISLVQPRITVAVAADGRTNWSPLLDRLARALQPNAVGDARVVSFSEIRIADGTLRIRDRARSLDETLEDAELSLAWPRIAKSFAATGHFTWHNERVDTSLSIADFPAALAGENSGLKFRANAGPLKAAFDGTLSGEPTLKIDGTLAADTSSLREALLWGGERSLPAGGLGRFALKAHAGLNSGTFALSNLNVELDGNVADGVLSFSTTGRQMLQGTLALDMLDLRPYTSSFRWSDDDSNDWNQRSFALDWLSNGDADLRLSAAGVRLARAEFGRTAVGVTLRSGRLEVVVGESRSFGGLITGNIAVAKSEAGAAVHSQVQFDNVDLERCLTELIGLRRLEGTGNLAMSVDSSGMNVEELTRHLNGTAQVVAKQGALNGLNVDRILRRLQRSPLSGNGDFRSGRTPFDTLNIGLRIAQGIATVDDVHLDGPNVRLVVSGSTSIPERQFDLSGTASLIDADNVAFELPFVVQGPWDSPLMLPDPQTLIRRSGATAPLRDALQDSKTRKAVQSAIERMIGSQGLIGAGNDDGNQR